MLQCLRSLLKIKKEITPINRNWMKLLRMKRLIMFLILLPLLLALLSSKCCLLLLREKWLNLDFALGGMLLA